jgi:signal transduction histidine kinase
MDNKEMTSHVGEQKNFDREYGLTELVSTSVLDELCIEIEKIAPVSFLMLLPDGTPYYANRSLSRDDGASLCKILRSKHIDTIKTFGSSPNKITIFPLMHELETIGYLLLRYEKAGDLQSYPIIPLGSLIIKLLNHLADSKYRRLLTAGLHGQVVEDSYAQLRQKAALLEKSERKYRLLAESLEKEVEKKAEKIKETQAQLMQQEKLAAIGRLAAGVAHEINNPLGFIRSNLGILGEYISDLCELAKEYNSLEKAFYASENNYPATKKIEPIFQKINAVKKRIDLDFIISDTTHIVSESKEGADRIKKIVSDLKEFASIDQPGEIRADINVCIDSALNILAHVFEGKAKIVKDYSELPPTTCYRDKMNQVFMNLLLNAADAIKNRGTITITTRAHKDNNKPYVAISIADTGEGIPPENLNCVFEPFFTTKDIGNGMGLGLSTSYDIIKSHGGTLNVESQPGRGTVFTIKIPVRLPPP